MLVRKRCRVPMVLGAVLALLAVLGAAVLRPALPVPLSAERPGQLDALGPQDVARRYVQTNDRRVQRYLEVDWLRTQARPLYGWTVEIESVGQPTNFVGDELFPARDWPKQCAVVVTMTPRLPAVHQGADLGLFEAYSVVIRLGQRSGNGGWRVLDTWLSPDGKGGLGI